MKETKMLVTKNMRTVSTPDAEKENFILDLVMLSCDGLHTTRDFIRHLVNNTDEGLLSKIRIIWIDNGSCDGSPRYLENKFTELGLNAILVMSPTNLGVIGGRNLGLKIVKEIMSKSDYIMFLDNDQYVQEGWLSHHLEVLNEGGYDLVGVEAWKCNHRFLPITKLDTKLSRAVSNAFNYVGCGGTLMKKEVFHKVGYFDDIFNPCYFEDPDYCYDKETHIMTKRGLIPFPEVCINDEILTKDKHDNLVYQKPLRIIKKYEENLLHFKNQQVDICCTKDQYLLIGYSRPAWNNVDSGKIIPPDYIKAKDIALKLRPKQCRYYIEKASGEWNKKYYPNKNKVVINNSVFDEIEFARFMGWFLSEGSVIKKGKNKNKKRSSYEVRITQFKKESKKELIKTFNSFKSFNIKINDRKDGIAFSYKDIYEYLQQFGTAIDKYVPEQIKNGSREAILAFLEEYIKGDGSLKKNGFSIVTGSDRMKDDLVELLVKTGRSFTFSKQGEGKKTFPNGKEYYCKYAWHIQSYNKTTAYLPPPKEIEYNDYVYDITIPNHKIFVVRNGKGCWSSNCMRVFNEGFKIGWNIRAKIVHMPHRTLGTLSQPEKTKRFVDSMKKFQRKWNGKKMPVLKMPLLEVFKNETSNSSKS